MSTSFCGKVSYGLYVYQGLTIPLANKWLPAREHGILFLSAVIAATLGISWLSFRFLESPFLKLKRLSAYDRPGNDGVRRPTQENLSLVSNRVSSSNWNNSDPKVERGIAP